MNTISTPCLHEGILLLILSEVNIREVEWFVTFDRCKTMCCLPCRLFKVYHTNVLIRSLQSMVSNLPKHLCLTHTRASSDHHELRGTDTICHLVQCSPRVHEHSLSTWLLCNLPHGIEAVKNIIRLVLFSLPPSMGELSFLVLFKVLTCIIQLKLNDLSFLREQGSNSIGCFLTRIIVVHTDDDVIKAVKVLELILAILIRFTA